MKKTSKFIPEIDVIAKLYRELIDDYGYKPSQIKLEETITIRKMDNFRADITIYDETNNLLETIIEVKSSLKPIDDNSLEYFSEILAESQAKFGMFYNGFKKICFKKVLDYQIIEIDDIPSPKKQSKKKRTDVKVKFWNILNHMRRSIPTTEYLEILSSLLYLKNLDEQPKSHKFFETLSNIPSKNKEMMRYAFPNCELVYLENLQQLEPKLLSILLFEMQNFSIKNSDPEEIADYFFRIWENGSRKEMELSIPKPILNFMYLYLAHYQDPDEMKKLNLLSVYGANRTCFDLIDLSSDHMNLTGKALKDYCENKLTVIDNNRSRISFLNVLLKIKKINLELSPHDPLEIGFDKKFHYVLAMPPIGLKMHNHDRGMDLGNSYENYLIQKSLDQLNQGGLIAIIVSPSFLFSHESTQFRQSLIQNTTIHGIIQLPKGTLSTTSVRPVILFLENSKPPGIYNIFMSDLDLKLRRHEIINQKVLHDVFDKFIEFQVTEKIPEQNDTWFFASNSQLIQGDWSIQNKVPMMQKLEDSKNAQFIKDGFVFGGGKLIVGKDIAESDNENSVEIPQIRILDIENTGLIKSKLEKKIHVSEQKISNLTLVQENDVLLSIKGTIGKIAIVTKHHSRSHVGSQFVIIRPSISKDTEYYLDYLNSDMVQYQLKKLTSGSIIPYLKIKDLEKIYLPPPDGMKVAKIKKLRKEIEENKRKLERSESELKELLKK